MKLFFSKITRLETRLLHNFIIFTSRQIEEYRRGKGELDVYKQICEEGDCGWGCLVYTRYDKSKRDNKSQSHLKRNHLSCSLNSTGRILYFSPPL